MPDPTQPTTPADEIADPNPPSEQAVLDEYVRERLTASLTATQEALGALRDTNQYVEPTDLTARADAFLVEASESLQLAIGEQREELSPEQRRIRELEAKLEAATAAAAPPQHPGGPPTPHVPTRHDVRPTANGRPRGMNRFQEGHNPLPPGEPDFQSSIEPPLVGYEPGQGQGRVAQATITGEGPSASEAEQRQAAIAAESREQRNAIRAQHGLPPELVENV